MKVLMSAYACEPGKGSEPEVGWQMVTRMAHHAKVQVITRRNNRASIEAGLAGIAEPHPEFLYYDLPVFMLWLKRWALGISWYYILWQISIRWRFRNHLRDSDVVHHVTFNGVQFPGLWVCTSKPVVLGPLGGGMTCPTRLLPLLGWSAWREGLRTVKVKCLPMFPIWRWVVRAATVIVAANEDTAHLLRVVRRQEVPMALETAITVDPNPPTREVPPRQERSLRLLWLGHLIPRKAPRLAILAIKKALDDEPDLELVLVGAGPEGRRLRSEVNRLGIADRVKFLGRIPKSEVGALMDDADVFVFTSVRDTSGNVVLEAMARGLPLVALCHQGVATMCDSRCAMLVPPGSIAETVNGLAAAVVHLSRDRDLVGELGRGAYRRAAENFSWSQRIQNVLELYRLAIDENGGKVKTMVASQHQK